MIGDRAVLLAKSSTAPCFGQHCSLWGTALLLPQEGSAGWAVPQCADLGAALPPESTSTAGKQCPPKARHCGLRDLECHRDLGVHTFLGT